MKKNVAKASVMLMVLTMMSKVLGFGRELVLASTYGANMYSDAYLVALNIPTAIVASFGVAISTIFIPVYMDIENKQGKENALKFTNNIFNSIACICVLLSILGCIFVEEIVHVLAIGFKGEIFSIAVDFTRILMIGIVFIGLTYLANAYLQIKENFIIPGLVSIPYNIIIIISMIISIKYSPYIMIWGTLLGIISQLIFQIPSMHKHGYRYSPTIDFKDKNIKKVLTLVAPVFIGVAVNQINAMVDRTLASTLVEGSISALNYANKLNLFVMALFISSISTVIYPILSKLSSSDNIEEFKLAIVKSINSIILLVIPISIGAIILAKPIVALLFQRGEFDIRATNMTSIALTMYSIGMIAFGLREILGKIFYSLHDTKTPMINGVITVGCNIVLNIIFVKKLELAGLALATSISSIFCVFLLFRSLDKKIGYYGQDKIKIVIVKSLVAGISMGFVTLLIYKLFNSLLGYGFFSNVISLIISVVVGAVVYGALIIIQKIDEVNDVLNIVKKKTKNMVKNK